MLLLANKVINAQVLSLRVGQPVATTTSAIINPSNLKIEGFYCQDRFNKSVLVLLAQDIREIDPRGYIVNDHDVLVEPKDLIRLEKTMKIAYDPIDKVVVTTSGERVGKVSDYAVDMNSMYIVKLYVVQTGLLRSFTGGQLVIDRSQITETTSKKIVIDEMLRGTPAGAVA